MSNFVIDSLKTLGLTGQTQFRKSIPIGLMGEDRLLRRVLEQLSVNRQGGPHSQPLARTVVGFIGDGIQLYLAVV
jgi:hypothetical protein